MSYAMAPGPALALGPWRAGSEPPPQGSEAVQNVGPALARRARYGGAMMWTPDYGVVACFYDPDTGLGYAQPA